MTRIKGNPDPRGGYGRWRVTYQTADGATYCQETMRAALTRVEAESWVNAKVAATAGVHGAVLERDA